MKTKLECDKLAESVPECLDEQEIAKQYEELLELAQELDLRRKREKKSFWQRIFPKDLFMIEM